MHCQLDYEISRKEIVHDRRHFREYSTTLIDVCSYSKLLGCNVLGRFLKPCGPYCNVLGEYNVEVSALGDYEHRYKVTQCYLDHWTE